MDVDAAAKAAAGLNLHDPVQAVAAAWIEYLADRLEWARDEICALVDRAGDVGS
jgi:hypothetical protein